MIDPIQGENGTVLLGLGGGAGKILTRIAAECRPDWLRLVYADTDAAALAAASDLETVTMGVESTQGRGCGDAPDLGERAAGEAIYALRDAIADAGLLVVVACLGRGTASGAAQVVARLARDQNLLCFFVVTTPFAVEGNNRRAVASRTLHDLRQQTDIVVAFPNDLLFTQLRADADIHEAFAEAHRIVADNVIGMAELARCKSIIPVDLASLKSLLQGKAATCSMGIGRAAGEARATEVVESLLASPMLGGREIIDQADAVVANLMATELSMGEMHGVLNALQAQLNPATRTFIGVSHDPPARAEMQLVLLSIRYQAPEPKVAVPAAIAPVAQPQPGTARKTAPPARGKRPARRDPADSTRQFRLPFIEEAHSLGIFASTPATDHDGENLDIPTFQRRGVKLHLTS